MNNYVNDWLPPSIVVAELNDNDKLIVHLSNGSEYWVVQEFCKQNNRCFHIKKHNFDRKPIDFELDVVYTYASKIMGEPKNCKAYEDWTMLPSDLAWVRI